MTSNRKMNSCKNCKEAVNGNYCPNCGQPAKLKRIDKHYIIQETRDFLYADKGMVYTIKKVLISPGESVKQFLTEDRYRFVKPITFVIITSLIYTLVNYLWGVKGHVFVSPFLRIEAAGSTAIGNILSWMTKNYAYANVLIGLFIAFWIKLFFRKFGYNLFEIFVLLCFVSGISILFLSVCIIFQSITHLNLMQAPGTIAGIYLVWAVGQFFDKKKASSYIKTLLAYFLGGLTFAALIVLIGFLIGVIIKH